MSEYSSKEFLEKIVPFSESLTQLLLENVSKCLIWNDSNKEFEINNEEIKKFSQILNQNECSKTDIIQSIILVAINIEDVSKNDHLDIIKDQSILLLCMSSLYMVKSGHFDIVFWLDIILETSSLLKRDGLITLIRWIYNCIDIFDWSISNPNIPFDKKNEFKQINSGDTNQIASENDNYPSIAAQRQLAHAKFVGILKVIGRRLVGYGDYQEAGMLRSLVYAILPSNQAGICRKTCITRNYCSYDVKETIDNINYSTTQILKEESITDNMEKEEGEMTNDKENESSELEINECQYLLEPSKYIRHVFDSLNRVDHFFQNPMDFFGNINDNNDILSPNKKKVIDNICKDIDVVVSHFEDYKSVDLKMNEKRIKSEYYKNLDLNHYSIEIRKNLHFFMLDSILEGIPSSLESIYFRINFAYRLSFIVCNHFSLVTENCKVMNEYLVNKMTPLLQRCLCCIEKYSREMNFSTIQFINRMIQYELLWLSWKNNNCVEINCSYKEVPIPEKIIVEENDIKKRRVEENLVITKFVNDEIFNKYINFVEGTFETSSKKNNETSKFDFSFLKDISEPDFSTERELLYLSPRENELNLKVSVNTKILNKFKDYNEKILIDLNPENGIEESEKSIKEPLFKWRCDRLYKRFKLFDMNSANLVELSVNNIEAYLTNSQDSAYPDQKEIEFLNIFNSRESS